ncbi:MAG: elongation factor Ts [Alphaproteobacteria bacterium]|nr:MAG: elongation factor Ts [Alphaproteobacteria bacterium]
MSSAAQIKDLRERTGAGMMDCKKALLESAGDMEKAIEWLRVKGLSKAAKKSSRAAAEGLVACKSDGKSGVMLEVNAETDFVAKNESFQAFVKKALSLVPAGTTDIEALKNSAYSSERSVAEELTNLISVIGENMVLRRVAALSVEQGVVASYVHGAVSPEMGRIGVLVALESEADSEKLRELGEMIAMHIAAARPIALMREDVSQVLLDKERTVYRQNALESGKKEEFVDKMVDGRINKYLQEIVLLDQTYMIDGKTIVRDVIAQAEKDLGASIKLVAFDRFELGEGIEVETGDFAAEVSSIVS